MIVKHRSGLIISIAALAIIMIAALTLWQRNSTKWEKYKFMTPAEKSSAILSATPNKNPMNTPYGGIRINSVAAAEKQTGYSLKVPEQLFGRKAQVFLGDVAPNGRRAVSIVYSDETTPAPSNSKGTINIGWRDPGLAGPADIVAQGQKDGLPFSIREHKGRPGFTLEKGVNNVMGDIQPRPAVVFWMNDGDIVYTVFGQLGMGLNELLPIADSID